MALNEWDDAVRDVSSTTGTGTMQLDDTPPAGFQSFKDALTTGAVVYYEIDDLDAGGTDRETGIGTWTTDASGGDLARDTVLFSTNGGAKVSWGAGDKAVRLVLLSTFFTNFVNVDEGTDELFLGVDQSLRVPNLTDTASQQILRLSGINRATPADNDEIYASWLLDSDDGIQEVARLRCLITDVTAGTENSAFAIDLLSNTGVGEVFLIDERAAVTLTGFDSGITYDNSGAKVWKTYAVGTGWVLYDVTAGTNAFTCNTNHDFLLGSALPGGPDGTLHIHEASAGTVTAVAGSQLVVEDSGTNYISLLASDGSTQGIYFGVPTSNVQCGIVISGAVGSEVMDFRTQGDTVRMQIVGKDVGVNEGTPGTIASWASGSTDRVFQVTAADEAYLVADGATTANIALIDSGAAANDKWGNIQVGGGILKIHSLNDDGSSRTNNGIVFDLGNGDIGIATTPSARLHVKDEQDAASVEVVRLDGNVRAVAADNDECYISLRMDVDDGVEEMARIAWVATDVTTALEQSNLVLYVRTGGAAVAEAFRLRDNKQAEFSGGAGFPTAQKTISANAATIDMNEGNHWELDLDAATGAVTVTLTEPENSHAASGTLYIKQDGTARDITWATTGAATVHWPEGEPNWSGGDFPASEYMIVNWAYYPTADRFVLVAGTSHA